MALSTVYAQNEVKEILLSFSPQPGIMTGVILIDATKEKYEISMDSAKFHEVCGREIMHMA